MFKRLLLLFCTISIFITTSLPVNSGSGFFSFPSCKGACSVQSDSDTDNKAASFNGDDAAGAGQYLYKSDSDSLDASSAFTVGCWFQLSSIEARTRMLIFKSSSFATDGYGLAAASVHFGMASDKRAQFGACGAGGGHPVEASTFGDLSINTWYFVVGKVSGGNIYIMINDGAWDSASLGGDTIVGNASNFQIGSDNGFTNQTHEGLIDSAFFAPTALDDATLTSLYNSGSGKKWCQLTSAQQALFNGWWELKEAATTDKSDSTANGFTLSRNDDPAQTTGKTSGVCICP